MVFRCRNFKYLASIEALPQEYSWFWILSWFSSGYGGGSLVFLAYSVDWWIYSVDLCVYRRRNRGSRRDRSKHESLRDATAERLRRLRRDQGHLRCRRAEAAGLLPQAPAAEPVRCRRGSCEISSVALEVPFFALFFLNPSFVFANLSFLLA